LDAADRIAEEFDRIIALRRSGIPTLTASERIVWYVVSTRCEIDINGFESVYEQHLDPSELAILVDGLNQIGEKDLASEFQRAFELLKADCFYDHMNWSKISDSVKNDIKAVGKNVEDQAWDLDEKLVALLDGTAAPPSNG
jgi:hypothetical protein